MLVTALPGHVTVSIPDSSWLSTITIQKSFFVWEHDSDAVGAIRGCVRDHDYRFRCMHYLRQNIEACCKGIDASWSGKQGTCFKAQSFEILMRWQYS